MRLKEISQILKENIDRLKYTPNIVVANNNFSVDNLINIRKGINNIAKTNLFKSQLKEFKTLPIYASTLDTLTISNNEYSIFSSTLEALKKGIKNLTESVDQALPINESENLLSIKLPNDLNFESLGKIIDLLKKSFSIPLAEIDDSIKIEAFESGSFWIDILVHSREAIELIGAITWAGAFIYKKRLEGKIHEKYIETLNIKNDALKAIQEGTRAQIDILIEVEAQNIQTNYYNGDDHERLERLKLSIKSMSELVEKGTEVHPNLLASETTNSIFPSFKNLNLIESKTKQISNE
ncbi:hypothetical protein [Mucilaginibacter flavus]|uniref:hypothetical protein n=1 Tax=Mucilaginibacter flavus TaxID=931504 RepID=UPI0025B5F40D|nr:hypothetical protein [Mucilaginibacter flavus]MDN3580677.1 hypothetical protein [Mucilaginibacter flavus]